MALTPKGLGTGKKGKTPKDKGKKTPEAKSVKFEKSKTPASEKKKFAKTPHSLKTPFPDLSDDIEFVSDNPILERKKRKLSFSSADEDSQLSPLKVRQPSPESIAAAKYAEAIRNSEWKPPAKKVVSPGEVAQEKTVNTVFVGNLPVNISKKDVKVLFSKVGSVSSVRFRCASLAPEAKTRKAGVILKQVRTGSTISAYIKFLNPKDAKAAMRMNGKIVKGHHIRVDLAEKGSGTTSYDRNKCVFLQNLDFDITDDELWEAFSSCGKIVSVRVLKNQKTYTGKGVGYVNFQTADAVELALKLAGTEIKGRPVIVQRWGSHSEKPQDSGKKRVKKGKPFHTDPLDNDSELIPSSKRPRKKAKGKEFPSDAERSFEFSGNKATVKTKKKSKKLNRDGLKKKRLAQILSKVM